MLIQTGLKGALCGALALSLAAGCASSDTGSQRSSNTSTGNGESRDAAADVSAVDRDAAMADAGSDSDTDAAVGGGGGSEHVRSEPWRIVALGDSITEQSCTSQLLWQNLRRAGAESFDMIGTRHSDKDCGVADADRDNEGHSGYRATDMVDDGPHAAELTAWCDADKGDVVLMHLGTNDIWQAKLPPATILRAFSKILGALRAVQPKVIVFVAQILPMTPGGCSECTALVPMLNAEIPDWAARESQPDSPVYVVDQFTGIDPATDTSDGVHPTNQGAKKMADKWSDALLQKLKLKL